MSELSMIHTRHNVFKKLVHFGQSVKSIVSAKKKNKLLLTFCFVITTSDEFPMVINVTMPLWQWNMLQHQNGKHIYHIFCMTLFCCTVWHVMYKSTFFPWKWTKVQEVSTCSFWHVCAFEVHKRQRVGMGQHVCGFVLVVDKAFVLTQVYDVTICWSRRGWWQGRQHQKKKMSDICRMVTDWRIQKFKSPLGVHSLIQKERDTHGIIST